MLYYILMHISCFMFSASELLLAIYFTCILVMEMMLDRSKLEQYSYSSSKCVIKQLRETRFNPCVGKSPWRKKWQPTPVFLVEKSHRQRSLVAYGPRGRKSQT